MDHTQSYSHLPTWLSLTALVVGLTLAVSSKKVAEWYVKWIDAANCVLVKVFRLPVEDERAWVSLQESPSIKRWHLVSTWIGVVVLAVIITGLGIFALWQGPPGTK